MINLLQRFMGANSAKAEIVPVDRTVEAARMLTAKVGSAKTRLQGEGMEVQLPRRPKVGFSDPPPASIETYRRMSRYPTIHICDEKILSPCIITDWSWETSDESVPEQIAIEAAAVFDGLRSHIIRHCANAMKYGRQFFEVVTDQSGAPQNMAPLLVDDTKYLQDKQTQQIIGIRNTDALGNDVDLPPSNSWVFRRTGEADSLSGSPDYENCREQWWWVNQDMGKFAQYLKRICNVIPKVTYPRGVSQDVSGAERPNSWMAAQILSDLQDGAGVAVLNEYASMVLAGDKSGLLSAEVLKKALEAAGLSPWVIDAIDPGGTDYCTGFIGSVEYMDYLLCRGRGLPEQSVLHTRYGARSTGQQHDNTADVVSENFYREVCESLTAGPVNRWLMIRYGRQYKGAVRCVQPALSGQNSEGSQKVLETLAANPSLGPMIAGLIDLPALLDELHIDVNEDERPTWKTKVMQFQQALQQKQLAPPPAPQNGNGRPRITSDH